RLVVNMWVVGINDVSEVGSEVELTDWEANGLAVEVMAVMGMEDVGAIEVAAALVGGGIGEEAVVLEVDDLI
ncbi:hypothetical protein KI387_038198, partial [Taxus chinensis]